MTTATERRARRKRGCTERVAEQVATVWLSVWSRWIWITGIIQELPSRMLSPTATNELETLRATLAEVSATSTALVAQVAEVQTEVTDVTASVLELQTAIELIAQRMFDLDDKLTLVIEGHPHADEQC